MKLGKIKHKPNKNLEVFNNPNPERDFIIKLLITEFTCLCPKTKQPDFAKIQIKYIADKLCIELKSLKLYMWSFRNEGVFHEAVTNQILNDLVAKIQPRFMHISSTFNVRGGIYTTIVAEHVKDNWVPKKSHNN